MVFSIILTEKDGTTIMVCKTNREDISAEVATPQSVTRLLDKMAGEDRMVEVISLTKVEL
jgi:hypothetical protein